MKRRIVRAFALCLAVAATAQAATVTGSLRRSPKQRAGADSKNRPLLFTPKPVEPGSSHSHFDISASPNLLMEPAINSDLKAFEVDIAKQAMQDMGWPTGGFPINIIYSDDATFGFNEAGRSAERKAAFEAAVEAWSLILGSNVTVNVEAKFESLRCSEEGGALAQAGPLFVFKDFQGGDPGVWYSGAMAEAISGENLSIDDNSNPDAADLRITFNNDIDSGCLGAGTSFYYGLDDQEPANQISFIAVALHELGHGLGFIGFADETTGFLFRGEPDIFTHHTYDTKKDLRWSEMTIAQRKKSATRSRKVSFLGKLTKRRAKRYLKRKEVLEITEPEKIAKNYDVSTAAFGPSLTKAGIAGDLVIVDDGSENPTLGCESVINAGEIAGNIAVVDRGECLFVEKVKNAQDAGAVGVVVVNNVTGTPPGLGGSDDSIVIPSVHITKGDGRKIKRQIRK